MRARQRRAGLPLMNLRKKNAFYGDIWGDCMNLTDEQSNAVDLFKTSRALKISAFAGTGKTSTLTAVAKSTSKSGLYLAFNKSTASEAKAKFPPSVDCKTTHSLAFRAVPDAYL